MSSAVDAVKNYARPPERKMLSKDRHVLPVFLIGERSSPKCSSGGVLRELPTYKHKGTPCLVTSGLTALKTSNMKNYSVHFLRSDSNERKTREKEWTRLKSSEVEKGDQGLIIIPAKKSKSLNDHRQFPVKALTSEERSSARLVCHIVEGTYQSFEVYTCELKYSQDDGNYVLCLGDKYVRTYEELVKRQPKFHPYGSVILEKVVEKESVTYTAVGVLSFVKDKICPLFFEPPRPAVECFPSKTSSTNGNDELKREDDTSSETGQRDEPGNHVTKVGNNKPDQDNVKQTVSLDLNSGAATEVSKAKAEKLKQIALDKGFEVIDTPRDGDCMYHALSHQLNLIMRGISSVSYKELRGTIADYVEKSGRQLIHPFVCDKYPIWEEFLRRIRIDGTWGDQWTLQAAADIYKTRILVINSESQETMIMPTCGLNNSKILVLGHVTESHYVSLQPNGKQGNSDGGTDESEKEADISSENNVMTQLKQTVPLDLNSGAESRRGSSTVDGSKNGDAFPPEINTTDGKLPRDRNSDQSDRTSHNTKTLAEEKNSPLKDQTKLSIQESDIDGAKQPRQESNVSSMENPKENLESKPGVENDDEIRSQTTERSKVARTGLSGGVLDEPGNHDTKVGNIKPDLENQAFGAATPGSSNCSKGRRPPGTVNITDCDGVTVHGASALETEIRNCTNVEVFANSGQGNNCTEFSKVTVNNSRTADSDKSMKFDKRLSKTW